jgi:L-fucose isomerase-like protein
MVIPEITLGVIVGTRGFFNPELSKSDKDKLIAVLDSLGIDYLIPPADLTPTGCIEGHEDAVKAGAWFRERRDRLDGMLILLPNFGDEVGIVETLKSIDKDLPLLVQASEDEPDKVSVSQRRDAFCGKLSVCNNLYQRRIRFTDTSLHTENPDSREYAEDLDRFVRICRVNKGLKNARIAAFGARPMAFRTVRFSEKLFDASGITVIPVDLSEIFASAQGMEAESDAVKTKLAAIGGYGVIPDRIPSENVLRQAKFSVAVEQFMDTHDCQASAIQCWDSLEMNYGCASCLTMSMMGEVGRPSACEMDIAGAVSMYALTLAAGTPSGFLDWNNNFGREPDVCVCTHCSNYPKSFMGSDIEISELDILGASLGRENCFGAVKGHVATGPMTFFRVSTDDVVGKIKAYLGEGDIIDRDFPMDGGIAVVQVPELRGLLRHICAEGFEHHVAMVRGRVASVLDEAIGKYLGWELYRHG